MSRRKKWPAAEKLRIVLAGMQPNVEVSELCRQEGINPTQYYGWKKQLLSSATRVFDAADGKPNASEEKKEAELRRMQQSRALVKTLDDLATIKVADRVVKIRRSAVAALYDAAEVDPGHYLVVGEPGAGKSGVVHDVAYRLLEERRDVVFLAADRLAVESGRQLQGELQLDHDLVEVLRNWPGQEAAYLIIDALDSARSGTAARFLRQLVSDTINLHSRWRVIVSIREFDLRYGLDLQELFSGSPIASLLPNPEFSERRHLYVRRLDDGELAQVHEQSHELGQFIERAKTNQSLLELIRNPFNLRIAASLLTAGLTIDELVLIQSQIELLDRYWMKRVIAAEGDASGSAREYACRRICEQMVSRRSLQANVFDLELSATGGIEDLKRDGVLVEWRPSRSSRPERDVVAFSHNMLFDYAASRMLLRGPDNPGKSKIKADPAIVLTIRPSFNFHFQYLWRDDSTRKRFWETALDFQGDDVPPTAQLIGPSVAVECARNLEDLMPLAVALDSTEKMTRSAAVNAVRHLTCAVHASGPIVGRPTSSLWIAWLEELSKRIDSEIAFPVRAMLLNCHQGDAQITVKEKENLSSVAIRVFDCAWATEQDRRWLIPVAVRGICRNFGADPEASEARLRRLVSPESLSAGKIDGLVELTSEIGRLFAVAPKLCEDIYASIFQANEPPADKVRLFGSQLFDLVSNLRQDFDVNKYALGKIFDSFLDISPEHAIPALASALEGYMARKSSGGQQPIFRFDFRGHEAHYSADGSSIWDGPVHRHDPEEMMIDSLQKRLESIAQASSSLPKLDLFLDLLAKHNRRAVIWRRLLQIGTKYPERLGVSLLPLVKAEIILTCPDTRTQAGDFLRVVYPLLETKERQAMENLIMGLPLSSCSRQEFAEDSRDRLLGCLSENLLVTADAGQRLAELKATNSVPPNEPDFQISSAGWMDQDDWETEYLGSLGVPHQEAQNANMRQLMGPLRDFTQKFLNDTPTLSDVDSVWPHAVKLADAFSRAVAKKVHEHLINDAIGYLAKFSQTVAKNNELLQNADRTAFIMENLLTASTNPEPIANQEMNDQFDRSPSWGSPSSRIHAAEGLPLLCRNPNMATPRILAAVDRLSRDPANVVRFMIADRLVMLYRTNNELFWQLTNRYAKEESSPPVLVALILGVLMHLPIHESDQAIRLAETLMERVPSTENNQEVRRRLLQLLVQRFVSSNHGRAQQLLHSICDAPHSYLAELVSVPGTLRQALGFALLGDATPQQKAICDRAWEILDRLTSSAASGWKKLRDQFSGKQLTNQEQQTFQSLSHLLDVLTHEIYFASGSLDDRRSEAKSHQVHPRLESRRLFLEKARPSLRELQSLGMPNVTHRLVEFLASYVETNPEEVFLEIGRSVLAAKESGYQQESLAADLIVRLVERYLAEFRHVLQSSNDCQDMLLKVLDQFVGWPAALKLVYRLEEVNR